MCDNSKLVTNIYTHKVDQQKSWGYLKDNLIYVCIIIHMQMLHE